MSHNQGSRTVDQAILDWIIDFNNKSKGYTVDCDTLFYSLGELMLIDNKTKHGESVDNFSEVINCYLTGKLSASALCFYLKKQHSIAIIEIKKLINNLNKIGIRDTSKQLMGMHMDKDPEVSVIISTFNRKKYLTQAINSLLEQNYPNIKIIIIDDNSNDGTEDLLKERHEIEPRIVYIRNSKNMGPGFSRRKAFETLAKGDYILFLDDDDYLIDPNYIREAVHFHVIHPGVSFVAANVYLEDSRTRQLKLSDLNLSGVIRKYDYFMNFEKKGYRKPFSTLTTLFKRSSLIEMDICHMKMVNDTSIYLRSLLVGDAGIIDKIVGVYRIHGDNITFHLNKDFIIENLEEKKKIKKLAVEKYQYDSREIKNWFYHNSYATISYFINNSARNFRDFKSMYDWTRKNCPEMYRKLVQKSAVIYLKRQLIKIPMIKKLYVLKKGY